MQEVPSPDDRMPWRPPWQTTPRRAPWARALRILFGAVAFFGGLAFLFVEMRGAPADGRPKGALQDLLILALAVFVALIAAYGFDQLLTGVWPSRRRWFQRAEDVLGKRLRGARRSGNLTVGYVWNAPVRVHWSVLIGLVLFGGFRPGAWIGFLVVILAHELGHAVLVRRSGLRVVAVSLHAIGGECQWLGEPTSRSRMLIAWGGVAGQFVLFGFAHALMRLIPGIFSGSFGDPLGRVVFQSNVVMAAFNLLPVAPLDGAEAWRFLFPRARGASLAPASDPVRRLVRSAMDRAKRNQR